MGFENGHLVRVSLVATIEGNEVVNTLHYDLQDSTVDDSPSLQGLADRLADDLLGPWGALFPAAWTINPVTVMDEIDPQDPTGSREGAVSGDAALGTGPDPSESNQAPLEECAVATLNTGLIGRRFRGRIFLPPIFDEGNTLGGKLAGARKVAYTTFMNAIPMEPDLITGIGDGSAHWCVYSKTQRAANLDPYAPAVTGFLVRDTLRWLRSRGH